MNKYEIKQAIEDLARSQGFYSRLNEQLESMPKPVADDYLQALEDLCFEDVVDLVIFLES